MDLSAKIKELILKQEKAISYQEILSRVKARGYGIHEFHEALKKVHRMRDVSKKNRLGTIYYERMQVHHTVESWRISKKELEQIYPNIKFDIDETNNADHPAFHNLDFSHLSLTPEQVKQSKRKRERDLAKELE